MKSLYGPGSADRIGVSGASPRKAEADRTIPANTQAEDDLKRIDAALRRLDTGAFGHCLYCGDQISVKRLDKDPAIDSCAVCDEG
ncbi:MAG: hypothetical protein RIB03_05610 [Henriciella sp.]|uniref:TraR/DksA family transcriptional regulator n=1 Tax=Henriciella sp. TaxID=1968823 RepID=UPI00260C8C9F|nr:hypothetical protein [Henriciella sp.]